MRLGQCFDSDGIYTNQGEFQNFYRDVTGRLWSGNVGFSTFFMWKGMRIISMRRAREGKNEYFSMWGQFWLSRTFFFLVISALLDAEISQEENELAIWILRNMPHWFDPIQYFNHENDRMWVYHFDREKTHSFYRRIGFWNERISFSVSRDAHRNISDLPWIALIDFAVITFEYWKWGLSVNHAQNAENIPFSSTFFFLIKD